MTGIESAHGVAFDDEVPLIIAGAGAAGCCAALAALERQAACVIFERDRLPRGSTALSAGLIPAAGTWFQRQQGIADTPELFARDILAKARHEPDAALTRHIAAEAGPTVEWLAARYGMPFDVIDDFDYPGHSARRMHALPRRSGTELIDRLRAAVEAADIPILTQAPIDTLVVGENGRIRGVGLRRPDGTLERIGCRALVLASNGYGGNADLVARFIPEMAGALYFGHPGNQGDALIWGEALGARLRFTGGYQGHGAVAHPHGILISWAVIMEGGFQVDLAGQRFSDEAQGYSEQAATVLKQQGGVVWTIFDTRIAGIARQFEDFRKAEASGAILVAETAHALADRAGLPPDTLAATMIAVDRAKARTQADPFGRDFSGTRPLAPPFCAVKVTGALFHTQGGLAIDRHAFVLRQDGSPFPNLLAAGGAAAGLSGSTAAGYLSGNGLLCAVVLGRIAGRSAAQLVG